ncbi:hypothetical protein NGM10_09185 [Halorussus salilacus]|uniref:hypothetical protein n=1 Tax=Halorussus salilacus TaxID=2953750 RepID=UPI0020A006FB|nr:hypothetical protein [Halorussus salilacus]USZ66904.1 hypothetical protein NGM10_09185 [Halorussus salilacus]
MSRRARVLSLLGVVPLVGLLALVVGVGTVALYAESRKNWTAYFLMERAMVVGAEVVVPLVAVALVGSLVLVFVAPRFDR